MLRTDLDPLPRRRVEPAAPGVGFAAAAQPVTASAIATGAEGLEAGPVQIHSNGFAMPAYRARPAGGRHFPVDPRELPGPISTEFVGFGYT